MPCVPWVLFLSYMWELGSGWNITVQQQQPGSPTVICASADLWYMRNRRFEGTSQQIDIRTTVYDLTCGEFLCDFTSLCYLDRTGVKEQFNILILTFAKKCQFNFGVYPEKWADPGILHFEIWTSAWTVKTLWLLSWANPWEIVLHTTIPCRNRAKQKVRNLLCYYDRC